MFEVCGVPAEKFRTISSAVDKLDKVYYYTVNFVKYPELLSTNFVKCYFYSI